MHSYQHGELPSRATTPPNTNLVFVNKPLAEASVEQLQQKRSRLLFALLLIFPFCFVFLASYAYFHSEAVPKISTKQKLDEATEAQNQFYFEEFKLKFSRKYENEKENQQRYMIFKENLKRAEKLNDKHFKYYGAKFGITKFSDVNISEHMLIIRPQKDKTQHFLQLSDTEKKIKGYTQPYSLFKQLEQSDAYKADKNTTDAFDWRDRGAVTSVKDQMNCGNCWAIAAAANMEGAYFVQGTNQEGPLYELSVQEITDCAADCNGCGGGDAPGAFSFVINQRKSCDTSDQYPFTSAYSGLTGLCSIVNPPKAQGIINSWTAWESSTSSSEMREYLKSYGPLVISIDATELHLYNGGIHSCQNTTFDDLFHNVVIVGYVHDSLGSYWIIKNCYGQDWGYQGYFYLSSVENEDCGAHLVVATAIA